MDSNYVIQRQKQFVDQISDLYEYDNNIRHLLYVIIPAFIIKYGVSKEKMIQNAFRDIRIVISNEKEPNVKAYYTSKLKLEKDEYKTVKYMVLENYQDTLMVDLIDNLVHEFNHAVNSYLNEIKVGKNYIYLRTGLTYRIYQKSDLSFVQKAKSYVLEEIINTKQTEDIINIIKKFDENNPDISNTIYAINSQTNHHYNSNSYYLESAICKQILENRTFIHTLETLRFNGDVYDIASWFDDITGEENSYRHFIHLLNEVYELELKYVNQKLFKSITINKVRDASREIMRIVHLFDQNVNYR